MYKATTIATAIDTLYAEIDEAIAEGDTSLANIRLGVLRVLYDNFACALRNEAL